MQYIFVLLILGVSNTLSFGNNSTGNSTTLTFQESQATTNRTSRTFNPQGEEQDATSSSPTYLSNEKNDQMRKSVLETLNSEIPELSQAPNQYDRVLSQQKTPVYHQQQPSEFQAPQSFSFTDAEGSKVNYYPRYPGGHNRETQRQGDESSAGKVFPVQAGVPLFNAAQRRTDEEGEYAQETNYPEDSYSSDSQRINSEQSGQSEFQQGQPPPRQPELEKPETRQGFFPEFPLSGPGFVGPAAFDPLPPPPPPLKGSVDYILIPLILIGLAGPIFVVLYVILGAFEAKLSPITRSLGGMGSYQVLYNKSESILIVIHTYICITLDLYTIQLKVH